MAKGSSVKWVEGRALGGGVERDAPRGVGEAGPAEAQSMHGRRAGGDRRRACIAQLPRIMGRAIQALSKPSVTWYGGKGLGRGMEGFLAKWQEESVRRGGPAGKVLSRPSVTFRGGQHGSVGEVEQRAVHALGQL